MKKSEKKMTLILVIVSIIIISIIYISTRSSKNRSEPRTAIEESTTNENVEEFVQVLENGKKLNNSTKLNEAKQVNGLEFSKIYLTEKDNSTDLIATVKNNTGKVNISNLDRDNLYIMKVIEEKMDFEIANLFDLPEKEIQNKLK